MVSGPRSAWAFFVILFLFHWFARTFFQSAPVILWNRGCFVDCFGSRRPFSPGCEDTSSVVSAIFMRLLSLFLHPDNTVANFRRSIAFRMSRNSSLGTATSAIWKMIFREWRTTFAPILISFSRNVVNVQ